MIHQIRTEDELLETVVSHSKLIDITIEGSNLGTIVV